MTSAISTLTSNLLFSGIVLFILLLLLVGGCIAAYMWVPMFGGKVDQQWKRMTELLDLAEGQEEEADEQEKKFD